LDSKDLDSGWGFSSWFVDSHYHMMERNY
jgi:hypothetical protein